MLNTARPEAWFPLSGESSSATVRLFCLPHAGAGAGTYREWAHLLPAAVEVVPVQLPGREARFREPAVRSAGAAVDQLLEPMLARIDRPYALFGHSMGALLAFELAHALTEHGRPPVHLFASGYAGPQLPADEGVHLMPDDDLCAHLAGLAGTPDSVLAMPELMRSMLPTLRADFEICEAYRYVTRPPLPFGITALSGVDDVGAPELEAWRELTDREFAVHTFPGGHFYHHEQPEAVLEIVAASLLGTNAEGNGDRKSVV